MSPALRYRGAGWLRTFETTTRAGGAASGRELRWANAPRRKPTMSVYSAFHVYFGQEGTTAKPTLNRIGPSDCFAALAEGFDDFLAMPTHLAFLGFVYALAGVAIASLSSVGGALQLVFPLAAGFAILGPFVSVFLYEMSRRRELSLPSDGRHALAAVRSPALPAIAALGLVLLALFAAWIGAAEALYVALYGPDAPTSASGFLSDALASARGHELILYGMAIGFVFAAVALCISVVSFQLLLDRDVGLLPAIATSLRLARANPLAVAFWGLIVAAALAVGSLPLFVGLAVVMPTLGHASWRFYRRAVARDPERERLFDWPAEGVGRPARFYSTPHSFLFPFPEARDESEGTGEG